ncbi:DUF1837 domain-containing protein [Aquimarina sp. I32.4]|uniref:HamA C-terminal domain-containing protein n=1 Tax=Aquimarina sp. I32.4 TaxID=2053903 RepID=UPI000CDEC8CF|nr:DUF1837 domain-containing protein [Aquimarina sp. I32.4]
MNFNSHSVIKNKNKGAQLQIFYLGFDFGRYQNDEFTEILMDVIVDFAFGYHTGILKNYNRRILKEAAKSIYRLDVFSQVKWVYVDDNSELSDCELKAENKYLKKGEFGEMILHLLLRDFFNTEPLLSKIHFKDTDNAVVHGFDIVHIGKDLTDNNQNSIYLGESKLYSRRTNDAGMRGVEDLVKDIVDHFKTDFLYREIALINKKRDAFKPIDEYNDKNTIDEYTQFLERKKAWFDILKKVESKSEKLQDFFKSVTIPLVCTYQSKIFDGVTDEGTPEFQLKLDAEVASLKAHFDKKINEIVDEIGEPVKTELNVVLILFPVPSKKELVKVLHQKLYKAQG